ncbi:hypothetical protein B9Z51_08635 [Limnohabitans sp. T6-5]|uniref:phage fiber-tail adaptor protein n=1 Tax=Limnohabitans sp. T6-5 TaxID=1100724 RepID=UPI000D398E2C|nr:hypothetical protein [Limnohabitans sp. T6-5]PUE08990.1 hypothetical protein B9Z51_08635 [Limnohabitans sp. T6-5]
MTILAKFEKQPADVQDYNIDYNEWLAGLEDTAPGPATPTNMRVVAEAGITVDRYTLVQGVATVWLSGGTDGQSYKVTVTVTTVGGRTKQAEIKVKVKEY